MSVLATGVIWLDRAAGDYGVKTSSVVWQQKWESNANAAIFYVTQITTVRFSVSGNQLEHGARFN